MSNTEETKLAYRISVLSTFAWSSMDWFCATCPATHRGHVEFTWTRHASVAQVQVKELSL